MKQIRRNNCIAKQRETYERILETCYEKSQLSESENNNIIMSENGRLVAKTKRVNCTWTELMID